MSPFQKKKNLNYTSVLQRKLPSHALSSHICPLCLDDQEDIQHLLFDYVYATNCWFRLPQTFNICWVFDRDFKKNVVQIIAGPALKKKTASLLWVNVVKALLVEFQFERNQGVFLDKPLTRMDHFESTRLNAISWCSLSKVFTPLQDYFAALASIHSPSTLKSKTA